MTSQHRLIWIFMNDTHCLFCNILVWMILFLIFILTNRVLSCTKPNLVYKSHDPRKEKRIGIIKTTDKVSILCIFSFLITGDDDFCSAGTNVSTSSVTGKILSSSWFSSRWDDTFRSDRAHDPQAVWTRPGGLWWRRWLRWCKNNIVCHIVILIGTNIQISLQGLRVNKMYIIPYSIWQVCDCKVW